jgi:hypothetical protein
MNVKPITTGIAVLLFTVGCSKAPEPKEEVKQPPKPPASVPDLKVSPAVTAKALNPKPGPKAQKKPVADTFGKGKASITVRGHPGGVDHSFWSEELDVDGNGQPVLVDVAWDNRHKVAYISRERSFACRNGQTADGSVLTTVYGKNNTLKRPTGSGWWVAELDQGECGVHSEGLYGCRFDGAGANTDCGSATIQDAKDDVEIVPLPQEPAQPAPGAPDSPAK